MPTTEGEMAYTTFPYKNNKLSFEFDGSQPPKCPRPRYLCNPPPGTRLKSKMPTPLTVITVSKYHTSSVCIKYLPHALHKLASSSLCVTSLLTRLRVVLSESSPVDARKGLFRIRTCAIFHKFGAERGVSHSFVGFIRQWPALLQVVASLRLGLLIIDEPLTNPLPKDFLVGLYLSGR